jgi:superoxide dismutase, Fe-Mn family
MYMNSAQIWLEFELRFWKVQEKEHTVVIRALAPELEPQYVEALKQFELEFAQYDNIAVRFLSRINQLNGMTDAGLLQEIYTVMRQAIDQSIRFVQSLTTMLAQSVAAESLGFRTVVSHIARESEYFIGLVRGKM